jgi:hypothetical protein
MTANKDLKRLVRTRMSKTGEAYTAARAVITKGRHKVGPYTSGADFAKLAGLSDAAVKKATGCGWERWVHALDKAGADQWDHRTIVEYARTKYKTPDWWAQMVVVGYERIKGLRAIGQRRGGGYEASKSKTINAPVATLFDAWSNARRRARWLPGVKLTVRTAQPGKSMRITWPDQTSVEVGFMAKGAGKSAVALSHVKLASREDADARKAFWAERLEALKKQIETD